MFARIFSGTLSLVMVTLAMVALGMFTSVALAQTAPTGSNSGSGAWRTGGTATIKARGGTDRLATQPRGAYGTTRSQSQAFGGNSTSAPNTLPNNHGQVSRQYDISAYTSRLASKTQPEQAIVDWILRETGYEAWHSEPFGFLSANERSLWVYHTPEMQAVVADIVDRFVSRQAESQIFSLRVVTIGDPDWRSKAMRLMKAIPVQTQGLQGWIMPKEDAALLLAELRNRNDYRDHSSSQLLVRNAETTTVASIRTRAYASGITPRATAWPGYEIETSTVEEGYSLEFSPLVALDGRTVDAVIKFRLNQVEKMHPVMINVPSPVAPKQRAKVEVPQMTTSVMHERFRWPADHILLLSVGMVAAPGPPKPNPIATALALPKSPSRADSLLFVECKSDASGLLAPAATTPRTAGGSGRRY